MKKSFQVEIDSASIILFFPTNRIKEKLQVIQILLESLRYILSGERKSIVHKKTKIVFYKEKMSRIFFVNENKSYSINFPFNILFDDKSISINYKNTIELNSLNISILMSFFKNLNFSSDNCLDFAEQILDCEEMANDKYWLLIKELLIHEDGYIRYDKDQKGYEEALKKKQKHRHPLNHFDIFYSNAVTFKLGLDSDLPDKEFIDTLNTETNCKYLKTILK